MPAGGERVGGIIKDCKADGLRFRGLIRLCMNRQGTRVVAPLRDPAPTVHFAELAFSVFKLALALRFADVVVDTDAECTLFGVGKGNRAIPRFQVDVEDEQPGIAEVVEVKDAQLF